jgi:formate hydrogenlyase transcriptional activator
METATFPLPIDRANANDESDRLPDSAVDLQPLSPPDLSQPWPATSVRYREEREGAEEFDGFTGRSPALRKVLQQVRQVALTDSTVLLLGETGTGKELLATQVHLLGARRSRPMVKVNCSAIPETLIESELFGREKGAFTGALSKQIGLFELADRSTIFLDEIGDLAPDLQVKLLRVIEEKEISRLGSPRPIRVDTRIIAATHRNLEQRVADGLFREDLYYRLNVFPVSVPPLRKRIDDIPLLVWRFVDEFSKAFGRRIDTIGAENMLTLQQYSWPGNVRELRNVVERAMITCTGGHLTIAVPQRSTPMARYSLKLIDVERSHIQTVLDSTKWRIRGAGGAAEQLGLKPTTLETRMAKLGLVRPRAGEPSSPPLSRGTRIVSEPPESPVTTLV